MSVAPGQDAAGATTTAEADREPAAESTTESATGVSTEAKTGSGNGTAHEVREVAESTFDVGSAEDFAEDSITPLELGDTDVVIIRQGGAFYALPDRCTHARFPLHDGELLDGKIQCAHHGATFDLETGRPTLPAIKKIQLFTADLVDGRVRVTLQER
ncbi:MAG: Rieske 2Fe-2S domain-containing protein [Trueperaceae bacterium]